MAKMFYTLDEAAQKLGVSADQVKQMVSRGQLQEFRDREKLMFKVEQVDLLAGGKEEGEIPLAADLEPLSLSGSGTGVSGETNKEQTGISIFEADETEVADPSAVTRVSPSVAGMAAGGSGAGMGQDESAIGAAAEVLDDRFGTPAPASALPAEAGALFEGGSSEAAPHAVFPMLAEAYDAKGSGLVGGLSLGVVVACLMGLAAVILAMVTTPGSGLLTDMGGMAFILAGAALAIGFIGGGVGFAVAKR
ncbi:MAG: helix-turn-helix domain-containing protein [Phycisphaerae bacterium]|nr:helix-turn-helix domain-containing protein [Phycisphaerae bacterium]